MSHDARPQGKDEAEQSVPALWLRAAVRVLSQVDRLATTPEGLVTWGAMRAQDLPDQRSYWSGGMQRHGSLEVCLVVRGASLFDLGSSTYRFTAPALALVAPGVLHSEGSARQTAGYASIWFGLTDNERVVVHVSEYRTRHGWSCPYSEVLPARASRRLYPWFRPSPSRPSLELEPLRAELLTACSDLHRDQVRSASLAGGSAAEPVTHGHLRVLEWVRRYVDRHYHRKVTLAELAELTRYSPNYLDALFSAQHGHGIRAYLIERRMQEALRLCETTDLAIRAIADAVGYDDPLYFSRAFRRHHGRSPSEVRRTRDEPAL
jgi:AraC-like DNA-binding protein